MNGLLITSTVGEFVAAGIMFFSSFPPPIGPKLAAVPQPVGPFLVNHFGLGMLCCGIGSLASFWGPRPVPVAAMAPLLTWHLGATLLSFNQHTMGVTEGDFAAAILHGFIGICMIIAMVLERQAKKKAP